MARKLERSDAKRLYIEEMKEIPEISRMLNVPEKTVYRWKAEDGEGGVDWDKEREAIRMTSFSAVKSMYRAVVSRLDSMVGEIVSTHKIDATEVYAIRQLLKSMKEIQKDVDSLGNILLAMEEFTDFLSQRDPTKLQDLHPYLVEFGNEMSKKYGRKR
jgi:hypothetical protein